VATFEGLSLREAGKGYTLVATTEGFTGATSTEFDVTPGAAASYWLELPANSPAGQEVTVSAWAHDAYGNVDTSYSGTAKVTSSDTEAVLPASVSFHQGVGADVKVTFKSPGLETLSLEDTERASLSGIARTHVTASEESSGCGCGATSGTNASFYLGLLALARYVAQRRCQRIRIAPEPSCTNPLTPSPAFTGWPLSRSIARRTARRTPGSGASCARWSRGSSGCWRARRSSAGSGRHPWSPAAGGGCRSPR